MAADRMLTGTAFVTGGGGALGRAIAGNLRAAALSRTSRLMRLTSCSSRPLAGLG